MTRSYLITGGSGYLGGSLLNYVAQHIDQLPADAKLYALVRTPAQAAAVQAYGAESITFDAYDEAAVADAVVGHDISVVFWLADSRHATAPVAFIRALATVRAKTGQDVHFLHTPGAKMFSDMAGAPSDRLFTDDDPDLYAIQKAQKAPVAPLQGAVDALITILDEAEAAGVRAYIFVPCIVYGKGQGFGNKISIQTVDIVKAAKGTRHVYQVDGQRVVWPVCHVEDTTALYFCLLKAILLGRNPDYGKHGFYMAASGSIAWQDIYAAMAVSLARRGVVDDATVTTADAAALAGMGAALDCPPELVRLRLGGLCTFVAQHGKSLGWAPKYPPTHILEAADDEVALILENLNSTAKA